MPGWRSPVFFMNDMVFRTGCKGSNNNNEEETGGERKGGGTTSSIFFHRLLQASQLHALDLFVSWLHFNDSSCLWHETDFPPIPSWDLCFFVDDMSSASSEFTKIGKHVWCTRNSMQETYWRLVNRMKHQSKQNTCDCFSNRWRKERFTHQKRFFSRMFYFSIS